MPCFEHGRLLIKDENHADSINAKPPVDRVRRHSADFDSSERSGRHTPGAARGRGSS